MEEKETRVEMNSEYSVTLSDIFFTIRKKKVPILITIVLFAVLGYLFSELTYVPAYYATSSLVVNANYQDSTEADRYVATPYEVSFAMNLVPTYTQILRSNRVMDYVVEELDLDIPLDQLRAYVTLKSVEDTSILHMTVTCPEPQLAIDISNAIAEVAPKAFQETIQIGSVNILDAAFISGIVPNNAIPTAAVAGFAGLILMAAYQIFLGLVFAKVKFAEDAECLIGLPVIGEVEHVKKSSAKKGLLLSAQGATSKFIESYMTLATMLNHMFETKQVKKLLVTGTMENEGKSLMSANLSLALAKNGKSVLLIDCDLRKPDVHVKFGIKKEDATAFYGYENKTEIKRCIVEVDKGLHIMPFVNDMDKRHLFFQSAHFVSAIAAFEREYDYIIFDSAPVNEVTDTLNLVDLSDSVLMVIRQDHALIKTHQKAVEKLSKVGAKFAGCVLNDMRFTKSKSEYLKKYSYRYNFTKRDTSSVQGSITLSEDAKRAASV